MVAEVGEVLGEAEDAVEGAAAAPGHVEAEVEDAEGMTRGELRGTQGNSGELKK
jgi:hypothetical protein